MNDRMKIMVAQVAGGLGLAALLMYGGVAMSFAGDLPAAEAVLWSAFGLVLGAAAAWAFGRLATSGLARWTSIALTGVLPVVTFFGWVITTGPQISLLVGMLWLNLFAGAASLAAHGWMMSTATSERARRVRTTRV